VYTAKDLVALAGRVDAMLDFACTVDDRNAPAFLDCPHEVWVLYSDQACVNRNVAIDPQRQVLQTYASASIDGSLRYYDVTQPFADYWAFDRDSMGTCTVPAAGVNERTAVELAPDFLQLGTARRYS
jgi:hypothetical protein